MARCLNVIQISACDKDCTMGRSSNATRSIFMTIFINATLLCFQLTEIYLANNTIRPLIEQNTHKRLEDCNQSLMASSKWFC